MKLDSLRKRYFSLDSKVEIYLPTRTMTHDKIDPELVKNTRTDVGKKMSILFGGATVTTAMGFYENSTLDDCQLEDVEIVYSYANKLHPNAIREVIKIAESIKQLLEQESVMVVINGTALFV